MLYIYKYVSMEYGIPMQCLYIKQLNLYICIRICQFDSVHCRIRDDMKHNKLSKYKFNSHCSCKLWAPICGHYAISFAILDEVYNAIQTYMCICINYTYTYILYVCKHLKYRQDRSQRRFWLPFKQKQFLIIVCRVHVYINVDRRCTLVILLVIQVS